MKKQYIADITIKASTKSKVDLSNMTVKQKEAYAKKRKVGEDGRNKVYTYTFTVEKNPVILHIGMYGKEEFPDTIARNSFIMKHFHRIGVGKFEDYDYEVSISNVKFSSNLMYESN